MEKDRPMMSDVESNSFTEEEWRAARLEFNREHHAARKVRLSRAGGQHTSADIAVIRERQEDRCIYCRVPLFGKGHKDHIIPISKKGTNNAENIQLTCRMCNLWKGDSMPDKIYMAVDPVPYSFIGGRNESLGYDLVWQTIYQKALSEFQSKKTKKKTPRQQLVSALQNSDEAGSEGISAKQLEHAHVKNEIAKAKGKHAKLTTKIAKPKS